MLPTLSVVLFFLLSAIVAWLTYSRRTTRFVADFAKLLESPRPVDGFGARIGGRAAVNGEFRGRQVGIVLQNGDEEASSTVVIAMATHAPPKMDTYDFADYKGDRDGEVAVFALEVTHSLRLRHVEGSLKASHDSFPTSFDPSRWQRVLEAMDTLCGSMERRGLPPSPVACRASGSGGDPAADNRTVAAPGGRANTPDKVNVANSSPTGDGSAN